MLDPPKFRTPRKYTQSRAEPPLSCQRIYNISLPSLNPSQERLDTQLKCSACCRTDPISLDRWEQSMQTANERVYVAFVLGTLLLAVANQSSAQQASLDIQPRRFGRRCYRSKWT